MELDPKKFKIIEVQYTDGTPYNLKGYRVFIQIEGEEDLVHEALLFTNELDTRLKK